MDPLYDRLGHSYHGSISIPDANKCNPLSLYVSMNVGILQHHFMVVAEHSRTCPRASFVLDGDEQGCAPLANSFEGGLYRELQFKCLGCAKSYHFATDGFNKNPENREVRKDRRKTFHSQLALRTAAAMAGLPSGYVDLETIAACQGNICRFGKRTYTNLMQHVAQEVDTDLTEVIQENREHCRQKIRELAAGDDPECNVFAQGLAGCSNFRTPRYTRYSIPLRKFML